MHRMFMSVNASTVSLIITCFSGATIQLASSVQLIYTSTCSHVCQLVQQLACHRHYTKIQTDIRHEFLHLIRQNLPQPLIGSLQFHNSNSKCSICTRINVLKPLKSHKAEAALHDYLFKYSKCRISAQNRSHAGELRSPYWISCGV